MATLQNLIDELEIIDHEINCKDIINIYNTLHNLISYIKLFNVNHIIKSCKYINLRKLIINLCLIKKNLY